MNILKKLLKTLLETLEMLWTELTRARAIQFVTYETEENERLQKEFAARKQEIMAENYKRLMEERLIPFFRDLELSSSGLLLTDKQVFERAHSMFLQAKKDGWLDSLNNIKDDANV